MLLENENKQKKKLKNNLDKYLTDENGQVCHPDDNECLIKNGNGMVERINKKLITDDGRQLLSD